MDMEEELLEEREANRALLSRSSSNQMQLAIMPSSTTATATLDDKVRGSSIGFTAKLIPHKAQGMSIMPCDLKMVPPDMVLAWLQHNASIKEFVRITDVLKMLLDFLTSDAEKPISTLQVVLDEIDSVVDDFDVATVFMKSDGFNIIRGYLKHEDELIVKTVLNILGSAVQNHPDCQNQFANTNELMQEILTMVQDTNKESIQLKAWFVLSCEIQNNPVSYEMFTQQDGYTVMLFLLNQTKQEKLILRICHTLNCLLSQHESLKVHLTNIGLVEALSNVLRKIELSATGENEVFDVLTKIISENDEALKKCPKDIVDKFSKLSI